MQQIMRTVTAYVQRIHAKVKTICARETTQMKLHISITLGSSKKVQNDERLLPNIASRIRNPQAWTTAWSIRWVQG